MAEPNLLDGIAAGIAIRKVKSLPADRDGSKNRAAKARATMLLSKWLHGLPLSEADQAYVVELTQVNIDNQRQAILDQAATSEVYKTNPELLYQEYQRAKEGADAQRMVDDKVINRKTGKPFESQEDALKALQDPKSQDVVNPEADVLDEPPADIAEAGKAAGEAAYQKAIQGGAGDAEAEEARQKAETSFFPEAKTEYTTPEPDESSPQSSGSTPPTVTTPAPAPAPTGTPTEKTNPLEQGYYFGYGGAGEKGSELAQSDQATLGQDSYILGQSSGLTHRGKTELPPAPFQQRSGAARRARIRQGQWDIAAPKREFLRGQARAVRGATDIATQELLKRTGKTADEIRALKDTDPEQFERLRAERDMHMQNLVNPDRPQFKAEDLGKVMEGGKWTGAYAPETALMEARKFREKHVEKAFTPEKAKKAGEWTRKLVRDSRLEDAGEAAYQKAIQEGGGAYQGDFGGMGYTAEEKEKYGIPLSEADKARKAAIAAASHDIDTASRKAAETREKAMGQVKIFRDAAGKVVGFSKPSGYKTDKEGKRTFDPFAAVSEEKVGEAGKDVKRFVKEGQQIRRSKLLDQLAKSGYLEGTPKVSTGARPRFTPEGVLKAPFGPKGTPLPTPPTLPEEVRSYFPEQQKTTPTPTTNPTTPKKKKPKYSPRGRSR